MNKKRNTTCHCFGTACHNAAHDVQPVAVPSKVGGPTVDVLMSSECRHRYAQVRHTPEHVRAHVEACVAAFGRECDA